MEGSAVVATTTTARRYYRHLASNATWSRKAQVCRQSTRSRRCVCASGVVGRDFTSTSSSSMWPRLYSSLDDPALASLPSALASSTTQTKRTVETDVPLVFVPGLKGSHLAIPNHEGSTGPDAPPRQRVWLTVPNLLNFPPRDPCHPHVDLRLPLTTKDANSRRKSRRSLSPSRYRKEDTGLLIPDGVVSHVFKLNDRLRFMTFYGHVCKLLKPENYGGTKGTGSGNGSGDDGCGRPTSLFAYDWRLDLETLADQLHRHCCARFPGRPVQLLGHSMGGLLCYYLLQKYPEKYAPGAVVAGVPFGTGVQYLEDLHAGNRTELGTCRQLPSATIFSFRSHWSFFPSGSSASSGVPQDHNLLLDVTDVSPEQQPQGFLFRPKTHKIRAPLSPFRKWTSDLAEAAPIVGTPVSQSEFDYFNVDDWERNAIGIFDPNERRALGEDTIQRYRTHMEVQLQKAKQWRDSVTGVDGTTKGTSTTASTAPMPPLTVCATDTLATVHQILRRKVSKHPTTASDADAATTDYDAENINPYEYDFTSGRSVPGDGRVDFDKAFPNRRNGYTHDHDYKEIRLDSAHGKQMCHEVSGGDFGTIWNEVEEQIGKYQYERNCRSAHRPRIITDQPRAEQTITTSSSLEHRVANAA